MALRVNKFEFWLKDLLASPLPSLESWLVQERPRIGSALVLTRMVCPSGKRLHFSEQVAFHTDIGSRWSRSLSSHPRWLKRRRGRLRTRVLLSKRVAGKTGLFFHSSWLMGVRRRALAPLSLHLDSEFSFRFAIGGGCTWVAWAPILIDECFLAAPLII